jgi:DNA polymerase-1
VSETLFIIDAFSLLYQNHYALSRLTGPDDSPVGAIYGLAALLFKLHREIRPEYIVIAFDSDRPTFRHEAYPEYKANRKPMPDELRMQLPWVDTLIEGFAVPRLETPGYEADDIMGTLAKKAANKGIETRIITRDKDLRQILDEHISIFETKNGRSYGPKEFEKEFGFRPELFADYLAIMGDSSDNIPGVKGIGKKTAQELVSEFGNIESIYTNREKIKKTRTRTLIENGIEAARESKKLILLELETPLKESLKELRVKPVDTDMLFPLFRKLGFKRFLNDLKELAGKGKTTAAERENGQTEEMASEKPEYICINAEESFKSFLSDLKKQKRFAFDTEATSVYPTKATLVGMSFAWKAGTAYYLPIRAPLGEKTLQVKKTLNALRPILQNARIGKILQNAKYDMLIMRNAGVNLKGLDIDTMICSYLLNPGGRSHGLDTLSLEYLKHTNIKLKDLIGTGKKQIGVDEVPLDKMTEYAAEDADMALRLADRLMPMLKEKGLEKLYRNIELPLVDVLAEMEFNGVALDESHLAKMHKELEKELARIETRIYEDAGENFNIASPKQLRVILFEKLGFRIVKKTKTGPSTDQEVLEELAEGENLPAQLIEYRTLSKLLNTYIAALPKLMNPKTGKIHTSFNQTVTATGRLSSSDPNLQNIPIRTELGRKIRAAFVPAAKNAKILAADYSQIELRMLAHLSGDERLREAFAENEDIHTSVAANLFGVSKEKVAPEQRGMAKTFNFSIIYGKTPWGLSKSMSITPGEAKEIIDSYFENYPSVREYRESVLEGARENGYVTTIENRRRYIPGIDSGNATERAYAERTAFNTVVQGSAADLIKVAMIDIHDRLTKSDGGTRMILQIHDELFIIGLLGGVGSGKSTVASILEKKGAIRIDCDRIVHELYSRPDVIEKIAAEFGEGVKGKAGIDRPALAKISLASRESIGKLMKIVHPLVVALVKERLDSRKADKNGLAVIEAAFLIEAGLDELCNTIWFIDADKNDCRDRTIRDRGWAGDETAKRERYQMPPGEKRARADTIVNNRSTLEALEKEVERLIRYEMEKTSNPTD